LQSPRKFAARIFTIFFSDEIHGHGNLLSDGHFETGINVRCHLPNSHSLHRIDFRNFSWWMTQFLPVIEMVVVDLTQKVRKDLIDCLSCLLLDWQYCLFVLRLPQFTLKVFWKQLLSVVLLRICLWLLI
jgi:hypothetical protein